MKAKARKRISGERGRAQDLGAPAVGPAGAVGARRGFKDYLVLKGLRQNNLKDLTLAIPHDRITALVGPSGSGKSSLAFDTLFAEGRWRFMESLSTYTRLFLGRMDRPEIDSIENIRPAIAVEQKNPVRSSRSTVATTTELYDYIRLLFARVGVVHCTVCSEPVAPTDPAVSAERLIKEGAGSGVHVGFSMPVAGRDPAAIAAGLLERGFVRARAGGRVFDLGFEGLPDDLPETVDVVVDRLKLSKGCRPRLVDSLEIAFREGGGEAWAELEGRGTERLSTSMVCPGCGARARRPTPISLSFNHPVGACAECKGFGNVLRYDPDKIIPDPGLSLRDGAVEPWTKPAYGRWYEELERYAQGCGIDLDAPFAALPAAARRLVFKGTGDFEGIEEFFSQLETRKYKLHIKVFISRYKSQVVCGACAGSRLTPEALSVRVGGLNIAEVCGMSIKDARRYFKTLSLSRLEEKISKEIRKQIGLKLDFLSRTGLGYITLDRPTKTLSGGEAQRASLATQLAGRLCGVLYILDEPSIGLHPVDVDALARQIRRLAALGNTVVLVEHDPALIRASDHIVELGPGAGEKGGRLVYAGKTSGFAEGVRTLTSDYLSGARVIHVPRWRRRGSGRSITLRRASGNNLKDVDFNLALGTMTCVTGVSGSGKSTLVVDTLFRAAAAHFKVRAEKPLAHGGINGLEDISGVGMIDQAPVGRTPRSLPITYMGGLDEIRRLYAGLPAARAAGLGPGHFSFNVPGGRCEACKGEGLERLEMYFLPDVYVKCAACQGRRYKRKVLDVKYRGMSIYEVLEMTFDEAARLFPSQAGLQKRFSILRDVGLGYLRLGQPATTLSGGEAQRLKIARELAEGADGEMLYILDEPTTGLHADDTRRLLSVLGRLVDAGNTVLIIEHNLDCIKTADLVVDLGPGGGPEGGRIVAAGTPEEVSGVRASRTGRCLKAALSGA